MTYLLNHTVFHEYYLNEHQCLIFPLSAARFHFLLKEKKQQQKQQRFTGTLANSRDLPFHHLETKQLKKCYGLSVYLVFC